MGSRSHGRLAATATVLAALLATTLAAADDGGAEPATTRPPLPIVSVGVDLDVAGRRFDYTDALTSNLRPYQVFPAMLLGLRGELSPFARTRGFARGLGVSFAYARAVGLSSAPRDGSTIATQWSRLALDLHARFWPSREDGPMLGFVGGFGWTLFRIDAPSPLADELPNVSYRYLRAGLEARIPAGRAAALASLGYRGVLAGGPAYDRFTAHTLGGVDVALGVALPLPRGFEAQLEAAYERYYASFAPEPGDRYVAGGALDEQLALRLGLSFGYGGRP